MNPFRRSLFTSVIDPFTSPRVVLALFFLLICFLVPSTILQEFRPILIKPVKVLLAIIGLNLVICTLSKLKTLRRSTLVIHLGSIIILIGGLISTFGFIATINIYEGDTIDAVYDWGIEQDVPLGYDLRVDAINLNFYPVGVKVGVLKNGQKSDLVVTRTEDSFVVESYRVHVLKLDPVLREIHLRVESLDGQEIGTLSTGGQKDLPPDFPLDFKLVAFQDPKVKRVWVDLELRNNGELIASGTSEVNHPLQWQGMKFFLTQVAADDMGRPYAGIQISKDPGVRYVYFGFLILVAGLLIAMKRWFTPFGDKKS